MSASNNDEGACKTPTRKASIIDSSPSTRPKTRNIVRWSDEMLINAFAELRNSATRRRVDIRKCLEDAAKTISPDTTADALIQQLTKRRKRFEELRKLEASDLAFDDQAESIVPRTPTSGKAKKPVVRVKAGRSPATKGPKRKTKSKTMLSDESSEEDKEGLHFSGTPRKSTRIKKEERVDGYMEEDFEDFGGEDQVAISQSVGDHETDFSFVESPLKGKNKRAAVKASKDRKDSNTKKSRTATQDAEDKITTESDWDPTPSEDEYLPGKAQTNAMKEIGKSNSAPEQLAEHDECLSEKSEIQASEQVSDFTIALKQLERSSKKAELQVLRGYDQSSPAMKQAFVVGLNLFGAEEAKPQGSPESHSSTKALFRGRGRDPGFRTKHEDQAAPEIIDTWSMAVPDHFPGNTAICDQPCNPTLKVMVEAGDELRTDEDLRYIWGVDDLSTLPPRPQGARRYAPLAHNQSVMEFFKGRTSHNVQDTNNYLHGGLISAPQSTINTRPFTEMPVTQDSQFLQIGGVDSGGNNSVGQVPNMTGFGSNGNTGYQRVFHSSDPLGLDVYGNFPVGSINSARGDVDGGTGDLSLGNQADMRSYNARRGLVFEHDPVYNRTSNFVRDTEPFGPHPNRYQTHSGIVYNTGFIKRSADNSNFGTTSVFHGGGVDTAGGTSALQTSYGHGDNGNHLDMTSNSFSGGDDRDTRAGGPVIGHGVSQGSEENSDAFRRTDGTDLIDQLIDMDEFINYD